MGVIIDYVIDFGSAKMESALFPPLHNIKQN
jgi:hypothetical protein